MSSTNINVGIDESGVNSTSIMKPPGGDCHDIFGADFHGTPSHHRVLKPPGGGTSSLFAPTPEESKAPIGSSPSATSAASQNGIDANGLNGRSGNVPEINVPGLRFRDKDESDVDAISTYSSDLSAEIKNLTLQEEERHRESLRSRNCVTGEGCQTTDHYAIRVHRQRDGNPVTGEGYDTTETQPTVPARTRIPPGGYSSGLW